MNENNGTALVPVAAPGEIDRFDVASSVQRVIAQTTAIQQCMKAVMKPKEHYGTIPGTDKPTLLQPGADKLLTLFWLRPCFTTTERVFRDDLIMYEVKCVLKHRRTGEEWAEGIGACNSGEKKYRNQTTQKLCPACKKPAILRSKNAGEGWFCWKKKDGCGAQFPADAPEIVKQEGVVVTADVRDMQNTIYKMAAKRAKASAVLSATAASDIFTQDLEELEEQLEDMEAAGPTPPAAATNGQPALRKPETPRASPIQVRDLVLALNDFTEVIDDAQAANLSGDKRAGAILAAKLRWANAWIAEWKAGEPIKALPELSPELANKLIESAKAFALPGQEGGK